MQVKRGIGDSASGDGSSCVEGGALSVDTEDLGTVHFEFDDLYPTFELADTAPRDPTSIANAKTAITTNDNATATVRSRK
jgi:hypothetical protein